eukprot:2346552-Pleurochrysis_carterae.AAC.3
MEESEKKWANCRQTDGGRQAGRGNAGMGLTSHASRPSLNVTLHIWAREVHRGSKVIGQGRAAIMRGRDVRWLHTLLRCAGSTERDGLHGLLVDASREASEND